jgi:hypothetical protein
MVMANSFNDPSFIEEKLTKLDRQYNEALHAGKKFSVLKDIRYKINELLLQLPPDGSRLNRNNHHGHSKGRKGHSIS